jgi:hypothetical protein
MVLAWDVLAIAASPLGLNTYVHSPAFKTEIENQASYAKGVSQARTA